MNSNGGEKRNGNGGVVRFIIAVPLAALLASAVSQRDGELA